jgi:hypothetical protein
VTLLSLADIGIDSNQFLARTGNHLLLTNVLALGFSLRFEDNRCQDRFDTGFSGVTIGLMNNTSDNQGTRCFYAAGLAPLLVDHDNRAWLDVIAKNVCPDLRRALDSKYTAAGFASHQ